MDNQRVTRGYGLLEKFLSKKRTNLANKLIPGKLRQGKILDIGCGSYPYFLNNIKFKEKYGLEKNIIKSINNEIKIINYDIKRDNSLPVKSNFFNVVTLLAVLEHFSETTAINTLKEAHRVLLPGGLLILTTPAAKADKLLKLMAIFKLVSKEEINEHKQLYTKESLKKQLQTAGFCEGNIYISSFELGLNLYAKAKK